MVVTFHIADQEFQYYSEVDWEVQLDEWRAELSGAFETEKEPLELVDDVEIVELMYGGELFFHKVPSITIENGCINTHIHGEQQIW